MSNLTIGEYCNKHRLTAAKFRAVLEYSGLHVTEYSVCKWMGGKAKPNKQYWADIYKATKGEVDIHTPPSIKSTETVLFESMKDFVRDQLRIEKKIDKILEKLV